MKRYCYILLICGYILLWNLNTYAIDYNNSVDSGEIRWWWSTIYSSQLQSAISVWNNYGDINIAPDTASTYEDLHIYDKNYSNYDWTWRWTYRFWTSDKLELNTAKLYNDSSNEKQNTIMHELGHALGLDHSLPNNILYDYQTSKITLWYQDKADYDYLWD